MSYEKTIAEHYGRISLLQSIKSALAQIDKTPETVTVEDLGPVDEFHIGGRIATEHLLSQLNFSSNDHILDVGCGLGGAARHIAHTRQAHVSGIDLTPDFVKTGNKLCEWVGLEQQIKLYEGSALALPFDNNSFDGAIMCHVGMNIEDKVALFTEINRVLRPNAIFGLYDIMQINVGPLAYPVPWANEPATSKLATPTQYESALQEANFTVNAINNRRDFALEIFKQAQAKSNHSPSPIGLQLLMAESTPAKVQNMVQNLTTGLIAPVEIIAGKA